MTTTTAATAASPYSAYVKYVPTATWKRWLVRVVPVAVYFSVVIASYQTWLNKEDQSLGVQITEIIRIPAILYLLVVFAFIVGWGMLTASNKCCNCSRKQYSTESTPSTVKSSGDDDGVKNTDGDVTEEPAKTEDVDRPQQT